MGADIVSTLAGPLHDRREVLVLIGSDKIHASGQRRLPADENGFSRTEVITVVPTLSIGCLKTVQRIKPNPVSKAMRMVDQRAQAAIVRSGPIPGLRLTTLFDHK